MSELRPRRVLPFLLKDLGSKMALLAGPRQCGKTQLAKYIASHQNGAYLNWDVDRDRRLLRRSELDQGKQLWVLDEVHKYRDWRNWLKGIYDAHHEQHSILVTGSAKLDWINKKGDSLAGRYFLHHLHPFTLGELVQTKLADSSDDIIKNIGEGSVKNYASLVDELVRLGGFPEPFLSSSERFASRWKLNYMRALVREDIGTLEDIRNLDKVEMLYERLSMLVGSLLSINALREDLEVAFETVRAWIAALERVYGVIRIAPFGPARIKAVKKEQKLYFWDWSYADTPSARYENLVAVHLLRLIDWFADIFGERCELRFFRNTQGHEVDFVVLRKQRPWLAIEVKSSAESIDKGMRYFLERIDVPHAFQLHARGSLDKVHVLANKRTLRQMPLGQFLAMLP